MIAKKRKIWSVILGFRVALFSWLVLCALFIFLLSNYSFAQSIKPISNGVLDFGQSSCFEQDGCSFLAGEDRYRITGEGVLNREGGRQYALSIFSERDELVGAALSARQNVLAVAIRNVTRSRRAVAGRMPRPDDLTRRHRIDLYNPRSGTLITSFDLGSLAPRNLSLSADGQVLMLAGQDMDYRRVHQVLVFNARSGVQVHEQRVDDAEGVALGINGFRVDGVSYLIEHRDPISGRVVYNSRDPFSVAEYEVDCSAQISQADAEGESIGVSLLEDAASGQGDALANLVASQLARAGHQVVERNRIREILEEIQMSTTGLTESQIAIDVGRLGVAHFLVFGETSASGGNINVNLRQVSVETGSLVSSCSMICRDCESRDLFEGIQRMAAHWSGADD